MRSWLFLFTILCLSAASYATPLYVYEDTTSSQSLADIKELTASDWQQNNAPNFSYTKSTIWIRFTLTDLKTDSLLLNIRDPMLDHATLYSPNQAPQEFGEMVPMSQRQYQHIFPVAPIYPAVENTAYYLKLKSNDPMLPIIDINTDVEFSQMNAFDNAFYGFYYGIMLAMMIYNLMIFFIVKTKDYFYYLLFISSTIYVNLGLNGFTHLFIFSENPQINSNFFISMSLAIATLFATNFSREFLSIRRKDRFFYRSTQIFIGMIVIWMLLTLFQADEFLVNQVGLLILLIFPFFIYALAIYAWLKKHPQASYFIFAWSFFLASLVMRLMVVSGYIENNAITFYTVQAGTLVEVVFLSIALAAKIKRLQLEKRQVAKEANQQLTEMNHKLTKSNALKDQFLTNLSHELRTPVNGTKGMLQILRQQAEASKLDQFDLAIRSTNNIQSIIEKLLILTESQDHSLSYDNHWFDFQPITQHLHQHYHADALDNQVNLILEDQSTRHQQYFSSVEAIEIICAELIENAIKYSTGKSVKFSIKTKNIAPDQDKICIEVKDTGIGIAEHQLSCLFTPFWQQDTSNSRHYGGLGIGLTVVNILVDLLGGSIDIQSEENQGTHILIEFNARFREHQAHQLAQDLKDVEVLIVEDNKVNQMVIKSMVKKMGCKTYTANHGQEALNLIKQQSIDIILMDCQMPVMDGFEATHIIRHSEEDFFNLPIIAVTANTTAKDRNLCFEVGMNAFLKKPIEIESLKRVITAYTIDQ